MKLYLEEGKQVIDFTNHFIIIPGEEPAFDFAGMDGVEATVPGVILNGGYICGMFTEKNTLWNRIKTFIYIMKQVWKHLNKK